MSNGAAQPVFTPNYSFFRSEGLTVAERALIDDAYNFFNLPQTGDKIPGVLILPDGSTYVFISGQHGGPQGGTHSGYIPRGPGSGVSRFTVTHIEGHTSATLHRLAAVQMGQSKVGEAALLIPKAPCGACDPNIPRMLPKGTRLFVVDPGATTIYQSISGLETTGIRFPKPELARNEMVIPGAGAAGGLVNLAIVAISMPVSVLQHFEAKAKLEARMKEIDAEVRKALIPKLDELFKPQSEGRTPKVNFVIRFSRFEALPLQSEKMDIEAELLKVEVSQNTDVWKGDEVYPETRSLTDVFQPTRISWKQSFSIELRLPESLMAAIADRNATGRWFDEALQSVENAPQRKVQLMNEREKYLGRASTLINQAYEQFLTTPPPPLPPHAAPSPGVRPPQPPPPPSRR